MGLVQEVLFAFAPIGGNSSEFQGGKLNWAVHSVAFVRTIPFPQQTYFFF